MHALQIVSISVYPIEKKKLFYDAELITTS